MKCKCYYQCLREPGQEEISQYICLLCLQLEIIIREHDDASGTFSCNHFFFVVVWPLLSTMLGDMLSWNIVRKASSTASNSLQHSCAHLAYNLCCPTTGRTDTNNAAEEETCVPRITDAKVYPKIVCICWNVTLCNKGFIPRRSGLEFITKE